MPGECNGIDPCAQEMFVHALDAAQARTLAQGHLRAPVLVVYPANGDPGREALDGAQGRRGCRSRILGSPPGEQASA